MATAITTETAEPTIENPEYVSVTWFARKFGKSRSTIHKACDAGKIAFIPFPSAGEKDQKMIPYSEVERIEAELKPHK